MGKFNEEHMKALHKEMAKMFKRSTLLDVFDYLELHCEPISSEIRLWSKEDGWYVLELITEWGEEDGTLTFSVSIETPEKGVLYTKKSELRLEDYTYQEVSFKALDFYIKSLVKFYETMGLKAMARKDNFVETLFLRLQNSLLKRKIEGYLLQNNQKGTITFKEQSIVHEEGVLTALDISSNSDDTGIIHLTLNMLYKESNTSLTLIKTHELSFAVPCSEVIDCVTKFISEWLNQENS